MESIKRTQQINGYSEEYLQAATNPIEPLQPPLLITQAEHRWRTAWLIISVLQLVGVFLLLLAINQKAFGQDLTWQRDGKTMADFATSASDIDRAAVVRAAIDLIRPKLLPTDTLIARGRADFGSRFPLYMPSCILENGGNANWFTSCRIDKTADKPQGTPGFVCPTPGRIEFRGMKFSGTCIDPNEDGGLIGWDETIGGAEVVAIDCEFDGSNGIDWVFYCWSAGSPGVVGTPATMGKPAVATVLPYPKTASFKRCIFRHARKGICGEGSGSVSQAITVEDCQFIGDANGSKTFGESSGPDKDNGGILSAIEIRGGSLLVRNCTFSLAGLVKPYTPATAANQYGCLRMAAVNDSFYSPGQANIPILLDRLTVTMQPTKYTPIARPVDVRFSTPVWLDPPAAAKLEPAKVLRASS